MKCFSNMSSRTEVAPTAINLLGVPAKNKCVLPSSIISSNALIPLSPSLLGRISVGTTTKMKEQVEIYP